ALATKLRLRQGFNDTRIVNIMSDLGKIDNIKKYGKQGGTPLNVVLGKVFNQKTADALKRINLFTTAQLISVDGPDEIENQDGDRRNRKLTPEYVIFGYNLLALSIALPAVSLDKRKKMGSGKIFKITQKGKAKILGEHYCNIPLADPNQFEIKKCKACSGNTAKMTGKEEKRILDWDEKRTSKKFKSKSLTNSLNESLFQGLLPIECLEIELLKKQKLSKALELVLQKSLVRNIKSNEQEFFFYTDGSLQLWKENQIGSSTKMGLGWLQLSEDKFYIVDKSTRSELAAIWLVVLLASSGTKLTIYSDSMAAINAITSINRSLAFSQFIRLGNFSVVSKIRDLVRLKGVCLNLVKVKGHSEEQIS
ncbi:7922_t:CDS:2, partial [Gigaspora margarita]